jgi:hypothetical protein
MKNIGEIKFEVVREVGTNIGSSKTETSHLVPTWRAVKEKINLNLNPAIKMIRGTSLDSSTDKRKGEKVDKE